MCYIYMYVFMYVNYIYCIHKQYIICCESRWWLTRLQANVTPHNSATFSHQAPLSYAQRQTSPNIRNLPPHQETKQETVQ